MFPFFIFDQNVFKLFSPDLRTLAGSVSAFFHTIFKLLPLLQYTQDTMRSCDVIWSHEVRVNRKRPDVFGSTRLGNINAPERATSSGKTKSG